jgi:hypothetical protein
MWQETKIDCTTSGTDWRCYYSFFFLSFFFSPPSNFFFSGYEREAIHLPSIKQRRVLLTPGFPTMPFFFISLKSQNQTYITTDGQSVLVSGTYLGTATKFSPLSLIIFRQLRICWCGASSLTRTLVCSCQFLLGIASAAFLRSESHGTYKHILLPLFSDSPNWRTRYLYSFLPGTGYPSYNPGNWVSSKCELVSYNTKLRFITSHLCYEGRSVNSISGSNICLLRERNGTQLRCVSRMQSFNMWKQVVYIVTTGL